MKKTKFLIKWPQLRAHQKQRIYKFIPILGINALLLFSLNSATAAPPACPPWVNIYDGNKQETITPRVLSNVNADGNVQYETCKQATDRREAEVQRRHANKNANKNIKGGSRDNCIFREPLPPFTEHKVEVRQTGEDPDGTPKYESCRNAQWRKQEEWRKSEGWEHREDLEDEIAKYNAGEDKKVLSAAEEAEEAAEKQAKASLITTAGAMAAGATAAACYSSCPFGCCGAAPYFAALSAGLGIAGIGLMLASGDNKGISADYAGNLLNDPNSTGGGGGGGLTGTTGTITAGTTSGMPTNPDVPLPLVKLPNGDIVVPTPENLGPYLKNHGIEWDPKNKKITMPDGRSYTADDLDKPELRQYANSGPVADLKKQMKDMEKQIAGNMEDGATDSLADDALEEDGLGGAGGGGFAGYDGGRSGSGGGGGTLMASLDRTPGSKDGSSKVAGMSVKMGKNQVGVRQDNIFEMIHRRYQTKRKRQQFIEIKF